VVTANTEQNRNQAEGLAQKEESSNSVLFYGYLDTSALGGAGFASHRNTTNTSDWNLADYDGIELHIGKSDGKRYILIIKDELLPKKPDGGDRSSLNWEYEFVIPSSETLREDSIVRIRWRDFFPTYRGRSKGDLGRALDVAEIKRMNIMMRRCVYSFSLLSVFLIQSRDRPL
jgi:Complex I intermediate-associated protein 30 (CIA30)